MKKIYIPQGGGRDFWLRIPMNNESAGRHLCMDDVDENEMHVWLESGYGGCWTLVWEKDGAQRDGIAAKVPASQLGYGTYSVVMAGKFVNGNSFRTKRQLFIRLVDREDQADAEPTMYNEEQAYWAGPAVLSEMLSRDGLNTYELAVIHGFEGTLEEYLEVSGLELQDLMVTKAKLSREVQTQLDRGSEKAITPKGDYSASATYAVNDLVYVPEVNASYVSLISVNEDNYPPYYCDGDDACWMKTTDGEYIVGRQVSEISSALTGYFTCGTAGDVSNKQVSNSSDYHREVNGGAMKVKMANANTASNVKMQFANDASPITLLYNGKPVDENNTWEDGEVISVYYDGTYNNNAGAYFASNAQGGGGKAEKIKYDNSQSGLAAQNVQGALDEMATNVAKKPNVVGDDSEHILNLTDTNGNVLAFWDSNGEMVFKKKISLVKRWIYTIPVDSSTDDKGTYYDTNGTLQKLGANSAASYFGTTKIDITDYRGKTICIKTNIGGGGYNLFVDANNNVLESWQQNGSVLQKQVPSDAQYLLLSNTFYTSSKAGVCTDPDVFYVDGLEYLVNMHKQWVSVVEDSSQNIFNITDENGNILAYFDANGIFHANITNIDDDEFQIHIPPVINSYVGDVLQLFKYPITLIGDYSNYGVNLSVATTDNNVRKQGRDLRRYFQFTPTAVGEYNIHVNVMNTRQSRMLAESTMKINVLTPTNPSSVKNILCIGDSEVEGYVNNSGITAADGSIASTRSPWTNELKALMTTSRTATDVLPAGLGLTNIHLIGTRNTSGGRHEGYGGKSADFFLSNTSSNPFYVGGSVDFNAYLAQNSVYDDTSHKGVDIIYIMLGGNNASEITRDRNKLVITKPTAKTQMIALLNAINTQLRTDSSKAYYNPNLKVVLLNYYSPWIEGYGYHPYGSGRYTDNCWTALCFYVCYQINNEIAAMDEYSDWVSSVMLSTQVDSENAFVYINKQKNVYMSETEIASLEAVHPNSIGYKMLGAAVMRDLLGRI